VNRADLQQLAETRLREAKVLLDADEWSGSYYLCGYAVECALKAVVAAQVNQGDFPDKKLAEAVYTHDLVKLRGLAGLGDDVPQGRLSERQNVNWLVTKDWRETTLYETKSETEARSLYEAVSDPAEGVLPWLRTHW
jgi:HEPN domain-containing protein